MAVYPLVICRFHQLDPKHLGGNEFAKMAGYGGAANHGGDPTIDGVPLTDEVR